MLFKTTVAMEFLTECISNVIQAGSSVSLLVGCQETILRKFSTYWTA